MSSSSKQRDSSYETRFRKIVKGNGAASSRASASTQPPLPQLASEGIDGVPDANVVGMAEQKTLKSCLRDLGVDVRLSAQQSGEQGMQAGSLRTVQSKWRTSLECVEALRQRLVYGGKEIQCNCVENSHMDKLQSRRGSAMTSRRVSVGHDEAVEVQEEKQMEVLEAQYVAVCGEYDVLSAQLAEEKEALRRKEEQVTAQEERIKELEALLVNSTQQNQEHQRTIARMSTQLQSVEKECSQQSVALQQSQRGDKQVEEDRNDEFGTYVFDAAVASASTRAANTVDYAQQSITGVAQLQQTSSRCPVALHQIALGRRDNYTRDMIVLPAKLPAFTLTDALVLLGLQSKTAAALGTPDLRVKGDNIGGNSQTSVDQALMGGTFIFSWQGKHYVRAGASVIHVNTPGVPRLLTMYQPQLSSMQGHGTDAVAAILRPSDFIDATSLTPLPLDTVLHLVFAHVLKSVATAHQQDNTGLQTVTATSLQSVAIPQPVVWTLVMMVDMAVYQLKSKDDDLRKAAECVAEANKAKDLVQVQLSRLEHKLEAELKQKHDMQQALITAKVALTRMKRVAELRSVQP